MNYNEDDAKETISKYIYLKDFRINEPNLYQYIIKHNLRSLIRNLKITGNRISRCIYVAEFSDNHCYVGATSDFNRRQKEHLGKFNKRKKKSPIYKHWKRTGLIPIFKQLTSYFPVEQLKSKEKWRQDKYKRDGWVPLHTAPPGATGNVVTKWTDEAILIEINKYDRRVDMQKYSPGAWSALQRTGRLAMIPLRHYDT